MERHYFECQCDCTEHIFRLSIDPDDGEVWFEMHLAQRTFFDRFVIALRYLSGKKSRFGAFDCVLIKPEDRRKLQDMLDYSLACNL
jgi:hypothetical protein